MKQFYDKNRRPVLIGDVLKVYHFSTGYKRGRPHFMYKWVVERNCYPNGNSFLTLHHLQTPTHRDPRKDKTYIMIVDDKVHEDYEIIQGYGEGERGIPFDERERLPK